MRKAERKKLEKALADCYRRERESAVRAAGHAERTTAVAAAAAKRPQEAAGISGLAWAAMLASHAFWAAPAAVVAVAFGLASAGAPAHEAEAALVASGPVLAAACLAGVVRARSCRMQELEASCPHNSVAVACARLVAFGVAGLLALALSCAAYVRIIPVVTAAAYALAPYMVAAAGGLMLARKVSSGDAALAAVAWSAGVLSLCALLRMAVPEVYGAAAVWAWAAVAAAGALWLYRETVRWMRLSAEGGCAPVPAARPPMF